MTGAMPLTLSDLPVVWQPPADAFAISPAGRMAARFGIERYEDLAARAVADPAWFWAAAAEDVGLRWMEPYREVLDLSRGLEWPEFFVGGKLNWADYSVDRWVDQGHGDRRALWWEGDDGGRRAFSYRQMKDGIDRAAGAFTDLGVGQGDVVAILLPPVPEAAMAVLGAVKIGAIVTLMFSGFGPAAIRERLEHSGARVLVTCDAFPRRGAVVPLKETADEASRGVDTLQAMLVVQRLGTGAPMRPGRDHDWTDACERATPVKDAVPMGASDPCLLLYTSGSTGRPKGCIHTHAGMPFRHAQETRHLLGADSRSAMLWITDTGWVMSLYVLNAALVNGGAAIVYEGTPDWPEPDRLWDVTAASGATILGFAPTVIRGLMRHGDELPGQHQLGSLNVIGSAGEPWNTESWMWCFRNVCQERIPIVNLSGGTEVGSSILAGTVFHPLKPGAFNGPALGMAADVVDDDGLPVREAAGELVVRPPWPGMTQGFWKDSGDQYLSTYWSRFPGLWLHGDAAVVDADGFWYLTGRSDDTLKIAGKRLGPSEVEAILGDDPAVVEAAAVGVPDAIKGQALACFVVLQAGRDEARECARLVELVATELGKALRPRVVEAVPALPKGRNGKVLRRVARNAYLGEPLGDTSALDNPEVLEHWPRVVPHTSEAPTTT